MTFVSQKLFLIIKIELWQGLMGQPDIINTVICILNLIVTVLIGYIL